jgi:flagellar hook assembly protein FlgD
MHLLDDNEDNRNDDGGVSSVDLFKEDISVINSYPNPAITVANISINHKNAKTLQILDLKGNVVFEIQEPQSNLKWNLRDLNGSKVESGAYIIVINTGRDYYYFKLIVA